MTSFMSQFRRSIKSDTRPKGGSGKGGKGSWKDEFRLPQDPMPPAPFIFIKGEYPDPEPSAEMVQVDPVTGQRKSVLNLYFKGKRHRRKYFKNGAEAFTEEICSKGTDQYNPQPCVGCMAMESGDKTVSLADFYAFGILHLANYHGHPIWAWQDKKFLTKDNSAEFIMTYDECTGRDCNYCRILKGMQAIPGPKDKGFFPPFQASMITTVFGRRRYLKLGKGHLSHLEGWDSQVSSVCGTCRGQMTVEGFDCSTCNSLLIDMEADTRTTEQIVQAIANPVHCPKCARGVLVREVRYCGACEEAKRQWAVNELTDVVSFGCRQGEGTNSTMMLKNVMGIEEFEEKTPSIKPFLDGKSLRQFIQEAKPYDFTEMFKPKALAEQAKRLDLDLPGVTSTTSPGYSSYQNSGPSTQGQPVFVPPPRPNFGK